MRVRKSGLLRPQIASTQVTKEAETHMIRQKPTMHSSVILVVVALSWGPMEAGSADGACDILMINNNLQRLCLRQLVSAK